MVVAAVFLSAPQWQQIEWKKLRVGLSVGLVFVFYLSAPKWITTALSSVWQAFRESQAETAGVKVRELRHKHDLKFCQCWLSHRLTLTSPLSTALSLPLTFTSLSCAHSLSFCLSLTCSHFLLTHISLSFLFISFLCTDVWVQSQMIHCAQSLDELRQKFVTMHTDH